MKVTKYILLLMVLAAPSHAAIIFQQNWENGNTGSASEGFRPVQYCDGCDHAITNQSTVASEGNRALRLYVREGDPSVDGHTNRANMGVVPGASFNGKAVMPYDQDRWVGFSIYVPSNRNMKAEYHFSTHAQNWGSSQCSINSASSPIVLRMLGPSYRYASSYGNGYQWKLTTYPDNTNGADGSTLARASANNDVDKWTHFVMRIRWSYGSNGILQVWKNGERIYNNTNFSLRNYPTPASCGDFYPKITAGNSGDRFYPLTAYFDNISWGDHNSSFAEVDPQQGASPSSPPPQDDPPVTEPSPVPEPEPEPALEEVVVEAEQGATAGLMVEIASNEASGGKYARNKGIGEGTLTLNPTIESAGLYRVVARVFKWGEYNDVLYYSMNDGDEARWDINCPYQEWAEVTIPGTFSLKSGPQTISFRGVNDSARLDYITLEKIGELPIKAPTGFKIAK